MRRAASRRTRSRPAPAARAVDRRSDLEQLARRVREQARARGPARGRRPRRRSPPGRRPSTRPRRAPAPRRAVCAAARRAAPRRPRCGPTPASAQDRVARRCRRGARISSRGRRPRPARPATAAAARGSSHVELAVQPVRAADPAGVQELGGQSTMSTSTRRPSLHGGGLHDGAQRVRGASAAADDRAVVVLGDRQLEDDGAVVLRRTPRPSPLGLGDERADEASSSDRAAGASAAIGG